MAAVAPSYDALTRCTNRRASTKLTCLYFVSISCSLGNHSSVTSLVCLSGGLTTGQRVNDGEPTGYASGNNAGLDLLHPGRPAGAFGIKAVPSKR